MEGKLYFSPLFNKGEAEGEPDRERNMNNDVWSIIKGIREKNEGNTRDATCGRCQAVAKLEAI